ncbi:hypothetical protein EK904_014601 [Melospiza melodia maxima]|nr:hypothetical protein EK904_014601 [Melospiza melodia maxima]
MLCCGALGGWSRPLLTVPAVPCPADLSQVEITRAYLAKEADELSLQQADVVLVLGEEDEESQRWLCLSGWVVSTSPEPFPTLSISSRLLWQCLLSLLCPAASWEMAQTPQLGHCSCLCRSEESYTVMNYATLDQVTVEKVESSEPPSPPPGRAGGHLLRVVLEKDSEGRREEVVLSAETL